MTENDFIPLNKEGYRDTGTVTWVAPSNIALVKYWGKRAHQIPANASLSFTLDSCVTTTSVAYEPLRARKDDFSFELHLDGMRRDDFKPKTHTFFSRIERYLPFLRDFHFTIHTSNTFPHSSGIASSASGMAALASCLMEMEQNQAPDMDAFFFRRKASFLARLGSGSACRSIQGELVEWGAHPDIEGSSDLYGIPYPYEVHPIFKNYQDTILLIDEGQKQVSSSVGHDLMQNHPFARQRFRSATENLGKLRQIFSKGDLQGFVEVVEQEALTLHAMMMTGKPDFILMKPNTLRVISEIRGYRERTGTMVCFTLDAGANVHLLFPEQDKEKVGLFILEKLVAFCEKGHYICDRLGSGARKAVIIA